MIANNELPQEQQAESDDKPAASFEELKEAAQQGDQSVIPRLRAMLKEHPELRQDESDLTARGLCYLVCLITEKNYFYQECLLAELRQMKINLLEETNGTLVESMIVDQVITTWLQTNHCRMRMIFEEMDNSQSNEFRHKQVQLALQSHLRCMKALLKAKQLTDLPTPLMSKHKIHPSDGHSTIDG